MSIDIALLLAMLVAAMVVFTFEWLSVDVVTLLLISALVVSGILAPQEAFSGFANEIIVILGSIFVIAGALEKTGVMDWLGGAVHRLAGRSEGRILPVVMTLSAAMSAFLSNTNSTAVLIPAVSELSRRARISPSRILMPLAYASIVGGTCTLIGTSTNLAASGMLRQLGYRAFGFFEFTAVGLVVVAVSIVYMSLLGRRLLPKTPFASLSDDYEIKKYMSELVIPEGSKLAGGRLGDTPLSRLDITVLAIVRKGDRLTPNSQRRLREADVLVVHAPREALLKAKESPEWDIEADVPSEEGAGVSAEMRLTEAIVMPQATVIGRSIKQARFRHRFGASVLAIHRGGKHVRAAIRNLPLKTGDVLLLQASEESLESLEHIPDFRLLGEVEHLPFAERKGLMALGALAAAVVAGSLGWVPLSVGLLLAALLTVALRCLTMQEAYRTIEWRLLVLIGGMTSFGLAMHKTEAAEYLANLIVGWTLPLGLYFVLGTFAILTMVLTQPMSNAAAAMVILPIALSTAVQLGVNPRTFAVMVTLSASLSFLTPLEPACLLVYGPGRYRFVDFVKSGALLTLLSFGLLLLLVPMLWPFE